VRGRSVLITGVASGIGRATALLCLERGAQVAGLDLDIDGLRSLAEEAGAAGRARSLVIVECDVASEDDLAGAFRKARDTLGPLDGAVANAGIELNAPLHELPARDWDRVLDVNLRGVYLTCKLALAAMLSDSVAGSIVCTSSPAAFVGFAGGGNGAYAASKGAVSALVRSLAVDYGPHRIRVNAVVPGATDTPLLLAGTPIERHSAAHADFTARAAAEIPLRRMADPREIAHAVTWLLSDDSSYVTGSHLLCDGGLLAKGANTF
jgi:NAD(P)-dependent dehydrogenase (short-subunit alcohol dehydrogenase family)